MKWSDIQGSLDYSIRAQSQKDIRWISPAHNHDFCQDCRIPYCRIPYCRFLLKMTKFHHIIFYLKKIIDGVYKFLLKAVIFRAILIRKKHNQMHTDC